MGIITLLNAVSSFVFEEFETVLLVPLDFFFFFFVQFFDANSGSQ